MKCTALFSEDRIYRYVLMREWDAGQPYVLFIGLNPSTADEQKDDPTIRRCIKFAINWGFGGLRMMNLFAYRSTDPKVLLKVENPVGWDNDVFLKEYAHSAGRISAAWGTQGKLLNRDKEVMGMLGNRKIYCLGKTKHGYPRHPLYVPYSSEVVFMNGG